MTPRTALSVIIILVVAGVIAWWTLTSPAPGRTPLAPVAAEPIAVVAPASTTGPGTVVDPATRAIQEEERRLRGQPVATVGGEAITLGTLEDELLRREGSEMLGDLARSALRTISLTGLADDAILLTFPAGAISRRELLAKLMPQHGAAMLEELISISVVSSALVRAGITIDDALLDREVAWAERKLTAVMAKQGLPAMDLDSFLKDNKGTTLAEYRAQPGFRVLVAGLHALVKAEALEQVGETVLRERFERDRQRWALAEAYDCSIIFVRFATTIGSDGKSAVSAEERSSRSEVVASLYRQIAAKQLTFGAAFRAFARSNDPDADAQGRVGWLRHDGSRDGRPAARLVNTAVIDAIFAHHGPFPALLPPVVHDEGVEIVEIHGWRPASQPDFATVREQLVNGLVEDELEKRSEAITARLRAAAKLNKRADGTVEVDGRTISVRDVQEAVLAREGFKAVEAEQRRLLNASDLATVSEDGDVLSGTGWTVPRRQFLAKLLIQNGARVREDLIGLVLVRHGLAKAGIIGDDAAVAEELARLERAYRRSPEAAKRDFRTFIISSYGAPPEALAQDEAFRALAATGRLVRREAELSDEQLHEFYAVNAAYYRRPDAVDLAIIPLLYRGEGPGSLLAKGEVMRVQALARSIHAALSEKPGDFATLWRDVGRPGDPFAAEGGQVGWIPRDGSRDNAAARRIPAEVVGAAFAAQGPWPQLLPPVVHARGVDVVMINARRAAETPAYADVAERVRRDCLEVDWDERLQAFVDRLRREATIEYGDLAALIAQREGAREPSAKDPGEAKPGQ